MSDTIIPTATNPQAHVTQPEHEAMYARSLADNDGLWDEVARDFVWRKHWSRVSNCSFVGDVSIRWFEDGKLNITENCIDRHLPHLADKTAIIWEGDDPEASTHISFQTLHDEVCKLANGLRTLGVKKGDRVTIYMPMILEATYAMLACARIGAVHSVIFGGFSPDAIRRRIIDCDSNVVITADGGLRGGKSIPLKTNVDAAIDGLNIRHVVVIKHTDSHITMSAPCDVWYHELVAPQPTICVPEIMDSEDPLFILYTSGSTGAPKGLLHTIGGYMVYAALTHKFVFDIQPDDVYWCTADVGWITGHSYIVYGPLLNGCTTLMFEGVPTYPDASRYWQVVDKHHVTKFYTAPTAIRSLMRLGDGPVKATSRASLQILGSVGEPINPEAWWWYYNVVGDARCPIVDTWWQTETGGHMITPLPFATPLKAGSASVPFFGVEPVLYDTQGNVIEGEGEGMLCIARSWPGQARSIWGDHARFIQTYFTTVKGAYFTSDGARRDADDYYWITGRVDDVINVSGHRLGTAEIESALVAHPHVAEAAVVGVPHDIKGQGIYAYVTLNEDVEASHTHEILLKTHVRSVIGGLATPDFIHLTPALPKTRSGKIMRRILRKIAEGNVSELGDISTLLNPEIVDALIATRKS